MSVPSSHISAIRKAGRGVITYARYRASKHKYSLDFSNMSTGRWIKLGHRGRPIWEKDIVVDNDFHYGTVVAQPLGDSQYVGVLRMPVTYNEKGSKRAMVKGEITITVTTGAKTRSAVEKAVLSLVRKALPSK